MEPGTRALVVEDDRDIARLVELALEQRGFEVCCAYDGPSGLTAAKEFAPAAVILDIMLPAPDGVTVCRTLRDEGRWPAVLMLTARDGIDDRIRGLDAGADDYLVKPFDFGELVARIRALLRRSPAERPAVLSAGDLELDPASHAVVRAGQEVALTAREFAVLEFLLRRAGQVVSRAELLDHVWDQNHEGSTNIVDVYVGYLRRKLEEPFGRRLIRTVRGAGYVIDPA